MKRVFLFLTTVFVIAAATGCGSAETSGGRAVQTEKIDLPPEDTDCLAVANEITIAFQSLYRNYLQNEPGELAFTISRDSSLMLQDNGMGFMPVVDDEIKCRDDLKNVLTEYCTDEFAERLLDEAVYRDFDGRLFKAWETGLSDPGRAQFGCYIEDCVLDENIMTVHFISIGAENENFDIDTEVYCRNPINDEPFDIMLVWENGRWFISDINGLTDESCIAFSYREDITKSMHEAQAETFPDPRTEEVDLPPEDTDCLAVANEITIAFQSLYRKYLQLEGSELVFKIDKNILSRVYFDDQPGLDFVPLINDEIRCCDDLKEILTEYCTDEFAEVLLNKVNYRDFEGSLYRAGEDGRVDIGRSQFGCYINECTFDGNIMTVGFIKIGGENENFDIDTERYDLMSAHDQTFEMSLVWKNGKWFIADLSSSDPSIKGRPNPLEWASTIAFSCREDITKSMHEAQAETFPDSRTEEVDLPPEDTDCLAVANEITIAFQSLYRNYLQVEVEELLFKIDKDYSSAVYFDDQPGYDYLPLINDEIRCCEDLKEILMEYCTDEFATVLLEAVHYRDFEGRLYKPAEDGRVDIGRAQFGCYINECTLDGDKMTVGFIEIGAENDNFDIDLERYCRMSTHDQTFEMTLVWKNGKWFISGLSSSDSPIKGRPCPLCWADSIAFSYRPDITKSMHETN